MRFILFSLIVVFAFSCSSNTNEIKNVKQKKQNTPVKAIVVSASTLTHKIQSSGTVLSNEEVELRNEISGRVIKINFQEGAFVKKDMVLVKMYDEDLQAQLKKIKIQEELARSEESRKRQLFEQQVISQQEYDVVLSQFNSLKADVELLKAQISKTEIKAPFAGFIGLRSISEGSFITPSTIIATLQQTDPVKIEFSVPEQYSQYLKPGLNINLTTERAKDYTALVYAVEPKIDFKS
jgi:membrane fusion protein (multidrug efflux system)